MSRKPSNTQSRPIDRDALEELIRLLKRIASHRAYQWKRVENPRIRFFLPTRSLDRWYGESGLRKRLQSEIQSPKTLDYFLKHARLELDRVQQRARQSANKNGKAKKKSPGGSPGIPSP